MVENSPNGLDGDDATRDTVDWVFVLLLPTTSPVGRCLFQLSAALATECGG